MTRLYLHIYLAFLALLVVIVVAAGILGALLRDGDPPRRVWVEGFAAILAEGLPADAADVEIGRILGERSKTLPLDFALWDDGGRLVAATGPEWLPATTPPRRFRHRGPPEIRVRLDDGRSLGIRVHDVRERHRGFLMGLLGVALVVAAGAYPLARRITKRLENLRHSVEAFGDGDLDARVPVRGRDEVAQVATTFNQSADRIQSLVESERRLVANASHELRSPLARLRVALELLRNHPDEARHAVEADRSIEELDTLVGDLLLGSRLAAQGVRHDDPELELGALVDEVCATEGVPASTTPARLRGDAKALRRMLRNLIDNAKHHGGGAVEVELQATPTAHRLRVLDRGPGVPTVQRERVFEPFYRGDPGSADSGGAGLGLSLVQQIARYHGGDARILPREGGGCVVEIDLRDEAR